MFLLQRDHHHLLYNLAQEQQDHLMGSLRIVHLDENRRKNRFYDHNPVAMQSNVRLHRCPLPQVGHRPLLPKHHGLHRDLALTLLLMVAWNLVSLVFPRTSRANKIRQA